MRLGYDNRNRVTSFNRTGSLAAYTYDANSNRLASSEQVTSDTDLDGTLETSDQIVTTAKSLAIGTASNALLGFTQVVTTTSAGSTTSVVTTPISYSLDANGALTSDGLRDFDYDASSRLDKVRLLKDGEAASVRYLHNALGQRVFKGEIQVEQTLPEEETLGVDFIAWLKSNFRWLFNRAQANTSIGTAYSYADGQLPEWALLGEYDNGSASGDGRAEYIWLPTESGGAIPIGLYKNSQLYSIHADHLGTPRLMKGNANNVVWQWPYSAFGSNRPTGILTATTDPNAAVTTSPILLKTSHASTRLNLRHPGQYHDSETGTFYNYFRNYQPGVGRYTQADPIGLAGGLSRFAYANLNPLSFVDPDGLQVRPRPGGPIPGMPGPRPMDPGEPWGPTYIPVPKMPDWLKSLVTPKSALERCEAKCDAKHDDDQNLCEAFWKMHGRNPDAYRVCMAQARKDYLQCYQDCEKECE